MSVLLTILCNALLFPPTFSWAGIDSEPDPFAFFDEEREIISASRRPTTERLSPATVYIVTAEQIAASGAQTIWDALRGVPGVDVLSSRAMQGEVSIRGNNVALQNRTLILIDGRTALNGLFDILTWESLSIQMSEIDRIEIVAGAGSALYGASAVQGVINIITKSAEALGGGRGDYVFGERKTHFASAVYGKRFGSWTYKISTGRRSTNRFDDSSREASRSIKGNSRVTYDFKSGWTVGLEGGFSDIVTQSSFRSLAPSFDKSSNGFILFSLEGPRTRLRNYWNINNGSQIDLPTFRGAGYSSHLFDSSIEHDINLPANNELTLGLSVRRIDTSFSVFDRNRVIHLLRAAYAENVWTPTERWRVTASLRIDTHPFTPTSASPRGGVVYLINDNNTVRLSGGTAFRNPTEVENHLQANVSIPNSGALAPNPPFTIFVSNIIGDTTLKPEKLWSYELSHAGNYGPLSTRVAYFQYRLNDVIGTVDTRTLAAPTFTLQRNFLNQDHIDAFGSEFSAGFEIARGFNAGFSYSYQSLKARGITSIKPTAAPLHKLSGATTFNRNGWTLGANLHWVDETTWSTGSGTNLARIPDYTLLNLSAAYRFQNKFSGLEIGIAAFNALDRKHFETLPTQSEAAGGQNGEIMRSRWIGRVTYHF
ncbi:MAG: hypothetical protein COB53_07630 [Elusimicrobia bacterium]|nr:MAG: hypothetical protein COB53_07630 [Elusimicrobiota bacterium]